MDIGCKQRSYFVFSSLFIPPPLVSWMMLHKDPVYAISESYRHIAVFFNYLDRVTDYIIPIRDALQIELRSLGFVGGILFIRHGCGIMQMQIPIRYLQIPEAPFMMLGKILGPLNTMFGHNFRCRVKFAL